ncbi:ATP synthase F1 subunit epsilon [Candidatus Zixiibacteriota bacterium]
MFKLSIVTPEQIFYDDEISSLIAPGTEGYLGVLSNHAPIITALKPGKIEFRDKQDKTQIVSVTKGFLEVSANTASILCDAAENADDIDIERAQQAYDRAKQRLGTEAKLHDYELDVSRAKEALERASNRIRVYKDSH